MNKPWCIVHLALLACWLCPQQGLAQDVQHYYTKAREAFTQREYASFYDNIVEANKLHPYHQGILYQLGLASALTDRREQSIMALKKAILIDSRFDLTDSTLKSLHGNSDFNDLKELQVKLNTPVINSDTAFSINDDGSHVESIAYHEQAGAFFFGCIRERKIIKRDNAGLATDFVKSGDSGMAAIFSVRINQAKGWLWACSSPVPEIKNYDSTLRSAVFKFDIKSGKLLAKYQTKDYVSSVFGDMALKSNGDVFVSDGKSNTIFAVNESTGQLDPFFKSDEFWNIQGICFSHNDRYLFISDYIKGPYRLDLSDKSLIKLASTIDHSLKGIDGLLFYNNSLIAIQNGVTPHRSTRYFLNSTMTGIDSANIIDRKHPAFNEPTMGCLSGSQFYYVANSPWSAYDDHFNIKQESIQNLVILKANLK